LSRDLTAQLCPNRDLAIQHGVTVLDAPQLITANDYAEIQVLLINLGNKGFSVKPDMAIAKLIVMPTYQPEIVWHEPNEPRTHHQRQGSTTPPHALSQAMPANVLS
jgi:dUTPase